MLLTMLTAIISVGVGAVTGPMVSHYLAAKSQKEKLSLRAEERRADWIYPGEQNWQQLPQGACGPGPMLLSYLVELENRGGRSSVVRDLRWTVRDGFGEGFYYAALYAALEKGVGTRLDRIEDRPVIKTIGPGLESEVFKLKPSEHAVLTFEDLFVVFEGAEDEVGPEGPAPRPLFSYRGERSYLEDGEEPLDFTTKIWLFPLLLAASIKARVTGGG